MPRELITVQVGQCGMQLGTRFWDLALREHGSYNKKPVYDDALSSFFRNVDSKTGEEISIGNGDGHIRSLRARALLVDMEEGVINEVLKGPLRGLFDRNHTVADVSGSGNNWAHGHEVYGPQYAEAIMGHVRREAETCDSLQSFVLLHSLGGGTGSGLGTYILEMLADHYPEVYRFDSCVVPSADDDVITSPYNSMLALSKLSEFADCVLPIHNQSLIDINEKTHQLRGGRGGDAREPEPKESKGRKGRMKAFDDMNTIGAQMLCNLTSSMRFPGSLNVDLNEITMNLVPFPNLHFLVPSLSPLPSMRHPAQAAKAKIGGPVGRGIDQMFTDAFSKDHQLIKVDPKHDTYLACSLMLRGDVQMSDINRNINRLKPSLNFIHWNEDGFKLGLCGTPPVNQPYSLLCLANNCCITTVFKDIHHRFNRLYRRKAHVHHYTEYMDAGGFQIALDQVEALIAEYEGMRSSVPVPTERLLPVL